MSFHPLQTIDTAAPAAGPVRVNLQGTDARRILDEVRVAPDRDVTAARQLVDRLAGLLQPLAVAKEPAQGGLPPRRLRRVKEHIAANLAEPLPISELAALVRLSPSHFTRAFRASVGASPHAFIMRERVERAKQLMLETDAPISEIALTCGMSDQSHMTRLFTRREGRSPAAWRRFHMDAAPNALAA